MRIAHSRIRTPQRYLAGINAGGNFYIGLPQPQDFADRLAAIGLDRHIVLGQQVLPSVIGKVTKFNANGGYRTLRHLPKEWAEREAEVTDWHGNHHTVYIHYQRYQRQAIPAPNIELLVRAGGDGNPIVVSPLLVNSDENMTLIKHIINLFLEIFGECEVLMDNLIPAFNQPVQRLNWHVLPPGNYPWQVLRNSVQAVINATNVQRRGIVQRRVQHIANHNPDFVAVGQAGFKGYVVFGFQARNLFILESIYTGHATYVLGQNWQVVSQLTKEQILDQNLHQARIIHREGWEQEINDLLR